MSSALARRQSGISLVALMVGLVLSMLVVLAMMSVYRITVRVSVDASQGAQLSGELSTGLLAAQMRLQGAGFRVTNPDYGETLVVLSEATLAGTSLSGTVQTTLPAEGNAVVWREDGRCNALLVNGATLRYLSSADTCLDASSSFTTLTWSNDAQLIGAAAGDNRLTIDVVSDARDCTPFGVIRSSGRLIVSLNVRYLNNDGTTDSNRPALPATVCLPNFSPVAAA